MTKIEEWAKGKPQFVSLFAPQIASIAREIPEILKYQKKHRLLTHTFQVPHFPSWYSFYRSRALYLKPFVQMVVEGSPFAQQLIGLGLSIYDISRHPEKLSNLSITPETLKEGDNVWDHLLRMSFADIQDNFDNTPLSPEALPTVQHYKDNHEIEISFLFLVAMPCWFFYKEWPSKLYRKARQGDPSAIHKLLRLDPFLLHDPSIGREIQKIRIHGKKAVYADLLNAPLKPIKLKLTSRTIKDSLAGLISLLAETMKQPLTSTEIRDLFDAIAKDADKRDIDTSLPDSQEAYSKVIQRNRPDWKPLLRTGQIKVK